MEISRVVYRRERQKVKGILYAHIIADTKQPKNGFVSENVVDSLLQGPSRKWWQGAQKRHGSCGHKRSQSDYTRNVSEIESLVFEVRKLLLIFYVRIFGNKIVPSTNRS